MGIADVIVQMVQQRNKRELEGPMREAMSAAIRAGMSPDDISQTLGMPSVPSEPGLLDMMISNSYSNWLQNQSWLQNRPGFNQMFDMAPMGSVFNALKYYRSRY